jgi:hypothetical protein
MFSVHGGTGEKDRKFVCYQDGGNYFWEQTAPDWREEASTTITNGLVGHWTFNEGSGTTAYDYSGNANHGTLSHNLDATVVAFTDVGTTTWTPPAGITEVDVLVVGGGGGGGKGGGGAGGLIFEDGYSVTPGASISITVGAGGTAGSTSTSGTAGGNGGNSVFGSVTAIGGGGGGKHIGNGISGGSGGGGGSDKPSAPPASGTLNQGNQGGIAIRTAYGAGGGGGGAGTAGSDATNESSVIGRGGEGGDGFYYGNIFGDEYGENGWFAGGGGGGANTNSTSATGGGGGGLGGGGDGALANVGNGSAGAANTGGGGGGGDPEGAGSTGGSGVVIIRYYKNPYQISNTTTPGQSLSFDGVDDYVQMTNLGFLGDTNVSFAGWIKVDTGSGGINNIFGFGNIGASNVFSIRTNGDGAFRFYFFSNDLDVSGLDSYYGTWTHIAAIYDATNSQRYIYVNGTQVASDSPANPNFTDSNYRIGGFYNEFFNGQIDDVRIYNRALRPEEIRYLYETTYRE